MAVATTLERYGFAAPNSHWINVRLVTNAGVAVGGVLTFTKPDGSTLVATVQKLLPFNSVYCMVNSSSKPSGQLLLPKGTNVTG